MKSSAANYKTEPPPGVVVAITRAVQWTGACRPCRRCKRHGQHAGRGHRRLPYGYQPYTGRRGLHMRERISARPGGLAVWRSGGLAVCLQVFVAILIEKGTGMAGAWVPPLRGALRMIRRMALGTSRLVLPCGSTVEGAETRRRIESTACWRLSLLGGSTIRVAKI